VSYRSKEEIESVRANRDCIDRVKTRLLEKGWATAEQLKVMLVYWCL